LIVSKAAWHKLCNVFAKAVLFFSLFYYPSFTFRSTTVGKVLKRNKEKH